MGAVLQTTKIALGWEMYCHGVFITHVAEHLHVHRDTIHRWITGIKEAGDLEIYLDTYLNAKKGPRKKRKVDPILKRRIWDLRERYHDCCGQKIRYFLKQRYDQKISAETIYKVLREKYQLRSKWKKNQVRGPVPEANHPREVIQMDTIDFGEIFAFSAVDIFSKEADLVLRPDLTAKDGEIFLHTCMGRRFNRFSELIQTDGGPEFKAEFRKHVYEYCHRHRYARVHKKNEQSYIESFNRSVRKECLGWLKYQPDDIPDLTRQIEEWLVYYHYERPHMGLNMQPPLINKVSDF